MANPTGYSQSYTDQPEVWKTYGTVVITDGYGAPSFTPVPSGVVSGITQLAGGTYKIVLAQNWNALLHCSVVPFITTTDTPTKVDVQLDSHTVGSGDSAQYVKVRFVTSSGAAVTIAQGDSFMFELTLRRTSL